MTTLAAAAPVTALVVAVASPAQAPAQDLAGSQWTRVTPAGSQWTGVGFDGSQWTGVGIDGSQWTGVGFDGSQWT